MKISLLVRLLLNRRRLQSRQSWSRSRIIADRELRLRQLRTFAMARSPFYQRLHRGLENQPLEELPVVKKADLMKHFDEAVTDRKIRHDDLESHLRAMTRAEKYLGKYWACSTSGSTGNRGAFLWSDSEWAWILASCLRSV